MPETGLALLRRQEDTEQQPSGRIEQAAGQLVGQWRSAGHRPNVQPDRRRPAELFATLAVHPDTGAEHRKRSVEEGRRIGEPTESDLVQGQQPAGHGELADQEWTPELPKRKLQLDCIKFKHVPFRDIVFLREIQFYFF